MNRLAVALGIVGMALAAAAPASAKPVTRAGVPVDALTPDGMERLAVRAPSRPGLPVRLTYAGEGAAEPELLVDVVVAADARGAHAALLRFSRGVARELDALPGVGDEAYATPGLVAFARDNVMIAVRRVAGTRDPHAIAVEAEAVVAAAPLGTPDAAPVTARMPSSLRVGRAEALSLPDAVLAATVRAVGPAAVRRDAAGWRITRTGPGDVGVEVVAVDELLRVR
jgi:hypothetical protein